MEKGVLNKDMLVIVENSGGEEELFLPSVNKMLKTKTQNFGLCVQDFNFQMEF